MSPHCHTLLQSLRDRGYRLTPQREMVVEAVAHGGSHMTAEDVFAQVQQRTRAVNIATVYRTLDLLVGEGLATRVALGDGRLVYATLQHGPHIHLFCRRCGQMLQADEQLLAACAAGIQARYGFAADLRHLSIPGLCRECQEAAGAANPGP